MYSAHQFASRQHTVLTSHKPRTCYFVCFKSQNLEMDHICTFLIQNTPISNSAVQKSRFSSIQRSQNHQTRSTNGVCSTAGWWLDDWHGRQHRRRSLDGWWSYDEHRYGRMDGLLDRWLVVRWARRQAHRRLHGPSAVRLVVRWARWTAEQKLCTQHMNSQAGSKTQTYTHTYIYTHNMMHIFDTYTHTHTRTHAHTHTHTRTHTHTHTQINTHQQQSHAARLAPPNNQSPLIKTHR
jgi:hypothetical protein